MLSVFEVVLQGRFDPLEQVLFQQLSCVERTSLNPTAPRGHPALVVVDMESDCLLVSWTSLGVGPFG